MRIDADAAKAAIEDWTLMGGQPPKCPLRIIVLKHVGPFAAVPLAAEQPGMHAFKPTTGVGHLVAAIPGDHATEGFALPDPRGRYDAHVHGSQFPEGSATADDSARGPAAPIAIRRLGNLWVSATG